MGEDRLRVVGQELRRLRMAAGLSGVELAVRAGVPQSTVSRVETGRRVSDPEVVVRLLAALGVEAAEFDRLTGMLREAYAESASPRVDAGVSFRLLSNVELERAAHTVRSFESTVIPGLLRTAEYVAAAKPISVGDEVSRAGVLDDEGRRFVFVITEGALRSWPGSGECMPGQLDHLLSVQRRPNVRLGVVPGSVGVDSPRSSVPLHGFTLYDDSAVSLETFTRELMLSHEQDVRVYVEIFEGFVRSAVFGDVARGLVERVGRDYRKVLRSIH